MFTLDLNASVLLGPAGTLPVPTDDEITRKLLMLCEGDCGALGPQRAAAKYGYSKQRYFQLRHLFTQHGALALHSQKRGPKTHYRRTDQVVRHIIRYRFLDPDASAAVIAQKLRQQHYPISISSVERVIASYGLQKKTLSATGRPPGPADPPHPAQDSRRAR